MAIGTLSTVFWIFGLLQELLFAILMVFVAGLDFFNLATQITICSSYRLVQIGSSKGEQ